MSLSLVVLLLQTRDSQKTDNSVSDAFKNIRVSAAESVITGCSPGSASSSEIGEVTERANMDEKVD